MQRTAGNLVSRTGGEAMSDPLAPLWRIIAAELYVAIDKETAAMVLGDKFASYTPPDPETRNRFTELIESHFKRLAGVLGAAQAICESECTCLHENLRAELSRLLKGE